MPDIEPRKTQTKVKHTILQNYLKAWGGIIINGWRRKPAPLHLVYIDCNASSGRYNGELEDSVAKRDPKPIFGSPIIGVETLDDLASWAREEAGINIRTNAILFEYERDVFDELKQSLNMAGLAPRVRETEDFFSLQDSEIAILRKDSTAMASKLVRYTQSEYTKFSFFTLDPTALKVSPSTLLEKLFVNPSTMYLSICPTMTCIRKVE
jgi:three-Cys-motif partner protein